MIEMPVLIKILENPQLSADIPSYVNGRET